MDSTIYNIGKTDTDSLKCLPSTRFQYIIQLRETYEADSWEIYPPFLTFSSNREGENGQIQPTSHGEQEH